MSDNKVSYSCHICGQAKLEVVPGYDTFAQVTSDCKPWPGGNKLCICRNCETVQKLIDKGWRSDTDKIYKNYAIYHQSNGIEQAVFDKDSGRPSYRSERLIEYVGSRVSLPKKGSLLDVGCGNGGLLLTFDRLVPHWSLAGTEFDDKYRDVIENIAVGATLYTCPIDEITDTFDLISMVHILEHILCPLVFLEQVKKKLRKGGSLVLEVPDFQQNPFDLLIADHCTHFTLPVLTGLLRRAGFNIFASTKDWIPKEISIIAKKESFKEKPDATSDDNENIEIEIVHNCLKWLESVRQAGKEASSANNFGIFGTSIAATWLFSEIGEAVDFFVDEDPSRIGKTYMGLPVYRPQDVPKSSHVFLALPSKVASNVLKRLGGLNIKFHLPPLLKI